MIQKFTVAWLLSLFVWNVALAGAPSLLLCLHGDLLVHLESSDEEHGHCESEHVHVTAAETDLCLIDDDCTDLELIGGESIPARVNEVEMPDLPVCLEVTGWVSAAPVFLMTMDLRLQPPSRAPPLVHWLTDIYIKKTVLRV